MVRVVRSPRSNAVNKRIVSATKKKSKKIKGSKKSPPLRVMRARDLIAENKERKMLYNDRLIDDSIGTHASDAAAALHLLGQSLTTIAGTLSDKTRPTASNNFSTDAIEDPTSMLLDVFMCAVNPLVVLVLRNLSDGKAPPKLENVMSGLMDSLLTLMPLP